MDRVTVDDVLRHGWSPPHREDRIMSLTQVRDRVIILTLSRIWCVHANSANDSFVVDLIGHF